MVAETPLSSRIASSFGALILFLYFGHFLGERIPLLRRLMLPASLIGGLLALTFVQCSTFFPALHFYVKSEFIAGWSSLPSILISIIFASMYLAADIPSMSGFLKTSGAHLCYVWFLAFGNWAVSCATTALILAPVWKMHKLFSAIGPDGFTGGLGAATGHASTYTALGFSEGGQLSVTCATIGMLVGLFVGTILMNVSKAFGGLKSDSTEETKQSTRVGDSKAGTCDIESYRSLPSVSSYASSMVCSNDEEIDKEKLLLPVWRRKALIPKADRVSGGLITVNCDAIETLSLHVSYIAMAISLASGTKLALIALESTSQWLKDKYVFSCVPLFPLSLLWGIITQVILNSRGIESVLDRGMMERISGLCIDTLMVAGIGSANLSNIGSSIIPLILLCSAMLVFQLLCFFFLARHVLPNFWVERGCSEFGTMTGATGIGLLLLRSMDCEMKTPAAEAFAAKQIFFKTLLGGGFITSFMFQLIGNLGNLVTCAICLGIMTVLVLVWYFVLYNGYNNGAT